MYHKFETASTPTLGNSVYKFVSPHSYLKDKRKEFWTCKDIDQKVGLGINVQGGIFIIFSFEKTTYTQ